MNVFLIGYRGTGKSTVGRLLADRLRLPFVDADEEIERRAGMSITEIFSSEGESGFRDRETRIVEELSTRDRWIISLGGGSVLGEPNRQAISAGRTVWLRAPAASIQQRLANDETTAARRPNLTAAGGLEEIERLLKQREPIYKSCADVIIDTETKAPDQVADEVLNAILPDFSQP